MVTVLIIIGIGLVYLFLFSLCKVAGDADRRCEEMYLEELKKREGSE